MYGVIILVKSAFNDKNKDYSQMSSVECSNKLAGQQAKIDNKNKGT